MKNKPGLKKCITALVIFALCAIFVFSALYVIEYRVYTSNYNDKIALIAAAVKSRYPDVTEGELIEALNSAQSGSAKDFFEKYGIDLSKDSALGENDIAHAVFTAVKSALLILVLAGAFIIFMSYQRRRDREISEIAQCIEKINRRNYELSIDSLTEDELSILKNEIYKTTVMLREAADNSERDKMNLKKSLEDISHQIKTPLTSILIMLDALIDDPDMDASTREEFICDIKRETQSVNFFVQTILKLSKLDANTVKFSKAEHFLKEITDNSVSGVLALCDLKNIGLTTDFEDGSENAKLICDLRWQTEALTNIIKNCVEHSKSGGRVNITCSQNSVYTMIRVSDNGEGIPADDLPHIFERFYRSANSAPDSIGIGLALAKSIIEEDNGMISVDSDGQGTTFTIKYFAV